MHLITIKTIGDIDTNVHYNRWLTIEEGLRKISVFSLPKMQLFLQNEHEEEERRRSMISFA
jgi:hypothetical protein